MSEATQGMDALEASTKPPRTMFFTLFAKLPPELRCMIWSFALSRPRILHMTAYGILSMVRPPESIALMSVNQESRSMSMERYNLINPPPVIVPVVATPFYFSTANDVCVITIGALHNSWCGTFDETHMALRDSVRVLAIGSLGPNLIPTRCWRHLPQWTRLEAKNLIRGLAAFPSLEKLIFLQGQRPEPDAFMAEFMRHLKSERENYSLGRLPLALEDIGKVTVLHCESKDWGNALPAIENPLLAYLKR
ncbi:hypothetical protein N431DRAFT_510325 [Stipitochalara longipes BDJ]|nr:hypothetical protein N431DRAFT_510325 [Stipitochalara longipes BDJ]